LEEFWNISSKQSDGCATALARMKENSSACKSKKKHLCEEEGAGKVADLSLPQSIDAFVFGGALSATVPCEIVGLACTPAPDFDDYQLQHVDVSYNMFML
jgi:hypothetical protein